MNDTIRYSFCETHRRSRYGFIMAALVLLFGSITFDHSMAQTKSSWPPDSSVLSKTKGGALVEIGFGVFSDKIAFDSLSSNQQPDIRRLYCMDFWCDSENKLLTELHVCWITGNARKSGGFGLSLVTPFGEFRKRFGFDEIATKCCRALLVGSKFLNASTRLDRIRWKITGGCYFPSVKEMSPEERKAELDSAIKYWRDYLKKNKKRNK